MAGVGSCCEEADTGRASFALLAVDTERLVIVERALRLGLALEDEDGDDSFLLLPYSREQELNVEVDSLVEVDANNATESGESKKERRHDERATNTAKRRIIERSSHPKIIAGARRSVSSKST